LAEFLADKVLLISKERKNEREVKEEEERDSVNDKTPFGPRPTNSSL